MAEKEVYIIKVEGNVVEVSPEVYYAYFRMERQERGQEEKKQRNAVVSYDALDCDETVGLETMPDLTSPSLDDLMMMRELRHKLRYAIHALPPGERELIQAIYFEGLSERDYARRKGISQTGVNKRRKKILSKMKTFFEFLGSF